MLNSPPETPVQAKLRAAYEEALSLENVVIVGTVKGNTNEARVLWAGDVTFSLEGAIQAACRRIFGAGYEPGVARSDITTMTIK